MGDISKPATAHSGIKCVVVTGPTATGKTTLGVRLARHFGGEIISADSRQVYRRLDIGTGKDLDEYISGGEPVAYHCIDIVDPETEYNLFRYQADALHAIHDCVERGRLPLIVGGTPLYINALLDNYKLEGGPPDPAFRASMEELSDQDLREQLRKADPDVYARTDTTQRQRIVRALEIAATRKAGRPKPPPKVVRNHLLLAPYYPRPEIHTRIESRLDRRLAAGLLQEVEDLHRRGISWERLEYLGLEYRYAARHLQGTLSCVEFRERLLARIRQFCKAQEIWFRKMEREGKDIYWIPDGDLDTAKDIAHRFLRDEPLPAPQIRLQNIKYA